MGLQEPKWHLVGEPEIETLSFDKDTFKYRGLEFSIPEAICLINLIEKTILQNAKWEPKEEKWIVGSMK